MGKRDTRYAFMNPIALARAKGSSTSSGPTIRDYLNRSRPSWEEVKKVLQQKKEGCSTLAAWENFQDDLNKKYNNDLKKRREMLLKEKSQDKLIKVKDKVSRLIPSSSSLNSSISRPHSKSSDEQRVNRDDKKRQKAVCNVKKEKKERKIAELKKNRKNDHKKHKNKVKEHKKSY